MFTRIKGPSQKKNLKRLTSTWMLSNNIKLLKFWNVQWNSIDLWPDSSNLLISIISRGAASFENLQLSVIQS
jgi:hypothetical protein